MGKVYTEAEAVEAVAAALLFRDLDIARNAEEAEDGTICGRMGYTFKVDEGTRELLVRAQRIAEEHGIAFGMFEGLTHRDLRRAMRERTEG